MRKDALRKHSEGVIENGFGENEIGTFEFNERERKPIHRQKKWGDSQNMQGRLWWGKDDFGSSFLK